MSDPRSKILGESCGHCHYGNYVKSIDDHVSYVVCDTCGAMQLSYIPQDYQEALHRQDYDWVWDDEQQKWVHANQTFGIFGGRKSVASELNKQESNSGEL